jgi:hypothetical protein
MRNRSARSVFDLAEELAGSTSAGRVERWIVGVVFAVVLALYSVVCIVSQSAFYPRVRPLGLIEVQGTQARAVGVLYLSAALFIHCHWFWSAHTDYHGYAQVGKLLSLVGILVGVGHLMYHSLLVQ